MSADAKATALAAANMDPSNIVRLNMYTTDVEAFMAAAGDLIPTFAGDGCKPVATLLGVAALVADEGIVNRNHEDFGVVPGFAIPEPKG